MSISVNKTLQQNPGDFPIDIPGSVSMGDSTKTNTFRGGVFLPITSVSASSYSIKSSDYLIEVDTTITSSTLNLPQISTIGIPSGFVFPLIIKDGKNNAAINNIIVLPFSGESIDLNSSTINTNRGSTSIYARSGSTIWESIP